MTDCQTVWVNRYAHFKCQNNSLDTIRTNKAKQGRLAVPFSSLSKLSVFEIMERLEHHARII